MAGVIEIVNWALAKIGAAGITSLDDSGEAAKVAAAVYDSVRDTEIAAHAWNFAKTRAMLPAETETPTFGWQHQYLLPADCLRLLQAGPWPMPVMAQLILNDQRDFVVENNRILTNRGPALPVLYLKRETDPTVYPPPFCDALACRLAVEMCERLTASNSNRELAWREYDQAVRQARRVNAIGLPPQIIQDGTWMLAHERGVM